MAHFPIIEYKECAGRINKGLRVSKVSVAEAKRRMKRDSKYAPWFCLECRYSLKQCKCVKSNQI